MVFFNETGMISTGSDLMIINEQRTCCPDPFLEISPDGIRPSFSSMRLLGTLLHSSRSFFAVRIARRLRNVEHQIYPLMLSKGVAMIYDYQNQS